MKQTADAQSRVNSWAQWSQHLILPAFISHILTTNSVQLHVFQPSRHGMHFICGNSCSQAKPFPVLGGIPSTDTWTVCDLNHKELETQEVLICVHIWEMKTQSSIWSSLSRIFLATCDCVCMQIYFVCVLYGCTVTCGKSQSDSQLHSRRRHSVVELMHCECSWCADSSSAWWRFVTDDPYLCWGSVLSLWLCHHFHCTLRKTCFT